jgi:hypothetical protein
MSEQNQPPREPALDLTDPKDRAMVREAARRRPKRWRGLTPELKDKLMTQLEKATDEVAEVTDVDKRVKLRTDIVKTGAVLEGQVQADEHLDEKYERLDGGKTTELVKVIKGIEP